MKTQEILSIVALGLLGVCLLCGLAKMAMKNPKSKQSCNHACSLSFFVAVVLLGVSQLIEEEGYKSGLPPNTWNTSQECCNKCEMGGGSTSSFTGCCLATPESRYVCSQDIVTEGDCKNASGYICKPDRDRTCQVNVPGGNSYCKTWQTPAVCQGSVPPITC